MHALFQPLTPAKNARKILGKRFNLIINKFQARRADIFTDGWDNGRESGIGKREKGFENNGGEGFKTRDHKERSVDKKHAAAGVTNEVGVDRPI